MKPCFHITPKGRRFLMTAAALLLALTPYLFADHSRLALSVSAALLLLLVGIAILTQRQTNLCRLISGKWHKNTPPSASKDGKRF